MVVPRWLCQACDPEKPVSPTDPVKLCDWHWHEAKARFHGPIVLAQLKELRTLTPPED
jgi:hypothetical protein